MKNKGRKKILVAMSGGVDSSVAAAILTDVGHEVIGVSMNLLTCSDQGESSCCTAADRGDARAVCEGLGISHYVVDMREAFRREVIAPFISDYLSGKTPSPCILCNEHLKFRALMQEADRIGADFIATGHYARIERNEGFYCLKKGVDISKDQSYFLFMLNQKNLPRILFPVGAMTKGEVRRVAEGKHLKTAKKAESQEICFVPDDDYAAFIEQNARGALRGPGDFVDARGNVLGRHSGIHAYTIGQRRGLRAAFGERRYVTHIDASKNEVVLGTDGDLMKDEIFVESPSFVKGAEKLPRGAVVKVRSVHDGEAAVLSAESGGRIGVKFENPVRAPAPGQAAVFYDGEDVIGGGWIGA
jgi:tRNA-specific 2-thiouridylase